MSKLRIAFILLYFCRMPLLLAADEAVAAPAPPTAAPPPSATESSNLTLELQDVNIFDVFKILSKKSGLNIVAGKNVQGQVSIFLRDVPVREALKTILQSQNLASIEEAGIIKVLSEEEYIAKFGRPFNDKRITQSFRLQYIPAEAIAGKLAELKSPAGKVIVEPRTNSLLITELPEVLQQMESFIKESDQRQQTEVFHLRYAQVETLEPKLRVFMEGSTGKLDIDKRSNRIVIMDIPARMEQIKALVEAFDVQVPQVLIESRIVEVRLSDSYRHGIDWENIAKSIGNSQKLKMAIPLVVAPPVGAAALSTLALGSNKDNNLKLVLSLLEKVGKTNLLSNPRITVLNNEEAKLAVATRQPFVSQTVVQTVNSTNTADNVQFVDVGVTLKVQPRISQDDFVEMRIRPEVSSSNQSLELQGVAQGSNTTFTRTRIPVVTTQQMETTVFVKSGTTLVVGGLIQDHQEKNSSKVPVLGSIPVVGRAFQSKTHDFDKTELVIFLTPTIVKPAESSKEEARFLNSSGQMLPFERVGEYPYRPTTINPNRYLETGEIPYWENPRGIKGILEPLMREGKQNAGAGQNHK